MKKLFPIILMLWPLLPGQHARAASVPLLPCLHQPPVIDGSLQDPGWQLAAVFMDFKTLQPDYGLPPSEKTVAYLAYDHDNLYVAIHCFDREPGKVKATLSARDQDNGDDWVAFCVDADNDELASYFFMSNPLGIQADGTLDAAANPNILLDLPWQSAGQRTPDGYVVEMAIPFRGLRFPASDTLTMGFKIARFISRKSEEVNFPAYHPESGAALTQFHKIRVVGIQNKRRLEILPSFTLARNDNHREGNLQHGSWKPELGISVKAGLTSSLTLDATFNPDFSQVESDAGQVDVNLRAAPFYSEKRPFFQEGQEWFGFSARPDGTYLREAVNTRTIVDPKAGLRLSGKLGSNHLLSALYALDEYPGTLGTAPNNKKASFSVLRYGRLLADDSYLGALFTGWNFDGQANYTGGADGRLRLNNRSRVEFHAFGSSSREKTEHNTGYALGAAWAYNTRKWNFRAGSFAISRDFETRIGYLTRSGLTTVPLFASRNFFLENKTFQRLSPYYWGRHNRLHATGRWETFHVFGLELAMARQTEVSLSAWLADEIYAGQRFNRNALRFEMETQAFNWLRAGMEWRQGQGILYDPEGPAGGRESEMSVSFVLQPISRINSEFSLLYADFQQHGQPGKLYEVVILRNLSVLQFNRFLFFRAITEYNTYRQQMQMNLLLSFTWIPGTAVHLGYGSQFDKLEWNNTAYISSRHFLNSQNAWYFKASYRWRN